MGIKRLGRRRLAAIEKLGILKDIGASDVMKKAIISATQHREGQKVTTDVVLDLGASAASLRTKAMDEKDPIGTNSTDVSYVCQVTDSVFGIVTAVDIITLEAITDGTLTDYDLMFGNADGYLGEDANGDTAIATDIGAKGNHETVAYDNQELKNKYIYITSGAPTGQKATCTIDLSDADHSKVVSGITRLRLTRDNQATIDFVANSGVAFGNTTPAGNGNGGTFGIGSVDNKHKLTEALSHAIHECSHFTTDTPSKTAGDGTSVSSITVTVANVTTTSNNANFFVDDPSNSSGITVSDFSGGIDSGVAITGGKVLLRFTGFMPFDDI